MIYDAIVYVIGPVLNITDPLISSLTNPKTHRFILRSFLFTTLFTAIVFIAFVLYSILYNLYIPNVQFAKQINLLPSRNSYMHGHVLLSNQFTNHLIITDLNYQVSLKLDFPSSPHNVRLGTARIHCTLFSRAYTPLYFSAHPITLTYRTDLIQHMRSFFFGIPILVGLYDQYATSLTIPLFEHVSSPVPVAPTSNRQYHAMLHHWQFAHFVDPELVPRPPSADGAFMNSSTTLDNRTVAFAQIEILAPMHVYDAWILGDIQFHGLRYFMYHWFYSFALFVIGILMLWELVFGLLVWKLIFNNSGHPLNEDVQRLVRDDHATYHLVHHHESVSPALSLTEHYSDSRPDSPTETANNTPTITPTNLSTFTTPTNPATSITPTNPSSFCSLIQPITSMTPANPSSPLSSSHPIPTVTPLCNQTNMHDPTFTSAQSTLSITIPQNSIHGISLSTDNSAEPVLLPEPKPPTSSIPKEFSVSPTLINQ